MNNKVLVAPFSFARFPSALGTLLEQAEIMINQGFEVHVLGCSFSLSSCDWNPTGRFFRCLSCIASRQSGVSALSSKVLTLAVPAPRPELGGEIAELIEPIDSISKLEAAYYRNFDIGAAVFSNLSTWLRNSREDLLTHNELVFDMFFGAAHAYDTILELTKSTRYSRVLTFNGRLICTRATLRACQATNTLCSVYEIAGDAPARWEVTDNAFVHHKPGLRPRINELWTLTDSKSQVAKGNKFFLEQRINRLAAGYSKSANQLVDSISVAHPTEGQTPIIVSLFTSSEDEFIGIGPEWRSRLFKCQEEAIEWIHDQLIKREVNFWLVVRVHPNGVKNTAENKRIKSLTRQRLMIVEAEDKIDSYSLIERSTVVLTFGSTLGLEATYWGKPSATLAPAFYDNFNCVYEISERNHVIDWILGERVPKSREACLPLGLYLGFRGCEFQYCQPDGWKEPRFRGKRFGDPAIFRLMWRIFGHYFKDSRVH